MRSPAQQVGFFLNGRRVDVHVDPMRRLADVLREDLGLTGTKVGCNAGDCGACTVRLDGRQACACMIAAAQVQDRRVVTVEGLANGQMRALQRAFLAHGAAQCGICTPGMLMAADDLLARNPSPTEAQVMDALGGVLCRCTGYRKIAEAVLAVSSSLTRAAGEGQGGDRLATGKAVGARLIKVDGEAKTLGTERYGADEWPEDCLVLRAVRSPHAHARFSIGDLKALHTKHPGLRRVLTAKDIPGQNRYGIYPTISRRSPKATSAIAAKRFWRSSATTRRSPQSATTMCLSPGSGCRRCRSTPRSPRMRPGYTTARPGTS
jgi:aerobic-type carbon monoxide dehydrogenase small subunit (CoxS/CutS family)